MLSISGSEVSISDWNFNRIFNVSRTTSGSKTLTFSNTNALAQSIVSETDGNFFKSRFLKFCTKLTNCILKFLSISGTRELIIFSSKRESGKGI